MSTYPGELKATPRAQAPPDLHFLSAKFLPRGVQSSLRECGESSSHSCPVMFLLLTFPCCQCGISCVILCGLFPFHKLQFFAQLTVCGFQQSSLAEVPCSLPCVVLSFWAGTSVFYQLDGSKLFQGESLISAVKHLNPQKHRFTSKCPEHETNTTVKN